MRHPVPLLVLVFALVLVRTAWIGDDALITLRSVMNVLHGYGLTFNVIERVQTFTHPLWAMLLTAGTFVIGNIYYATFALSFAASLTAFWLALRGAASLPHTAVAGAALLFSNAFVDYATSGLESPLAYLLAAWFAATALAAADGRSRLARLWTIASLLYLTRPDLVLIAAPSLLVWTWRGRSAGGRPWRAMAIGAIPAVLWTLFALVYYGSVFPNTAYAKLGMDVSRVELWHQGVLYFVDSLDRDPVTLVTIGVALAMGLAERGVARHLACGVALYLAYVASIGGDFMTGRFFAVPLYVAVLLVSRVSRLEPRTAYATAAALLAFGLAGARVPLASDSRVERTANMDTGIVDERAAYFRTHSVVWSTRQSFTRPEWSDPAPERLPRHVLNTCGLMGVAGLDWGPRTHLLDECGLADPLLARLPAVFNIHWRIGHFRRLVPAGYRETLERGPNLIEDQAVRALYADLEIITRSNRLLSTERLAAIWRVNTGRSARAIDWSFYRHGGQIASLADLAVAKPDGTEWNAPGVRVITQPIAIFCDDKAGRRYLDLSVDSNDRYHLLFVKNNRVVASTEVGPVPEYRRQAGLVAFTIDLPPSATRRGFDTVIVAPGAGDNSHSIGHLWLDGQPETDEALGRRVAARNSK